ncbi:MAG: glycosyltransferase, partial [Gammaproteobacteria bacterium]
MTKENTTIKVLHIASGDLWAGAEVQLFTLAKALNNQQDIKINVVLLNHGMLEQKLLNNGVNVIVLDESRLNGLQVLLQLISTIRTIKPDVIHTHRVKENIFGSIAALLNGNIPTLRTSHGAPEHKPAWHNIPKRVILFLDWFSGRLLQKKIIAVSDDLAEILQKDFPADKIKVIENGIDLATLTTTVKSVKLDIEQNVPSFRIGIAGRLVPVKRVDLFIKAAAELLNTRPELKTSFHIFGDGPLRAELTTLSKKLNIEKMIHFEGHCENMRQELANLDILLITSDHEGLPMVLLEAMALKTAVIAHDVGGIPTVLKQGECGVLVSEHQPLAYADAIYKLIESPEDRKNYCCNA